MHLSVSTLLKQLESADSEALRDQHLRGAHVDDQWMGGRGDWALWGTLTLRSSGGFLAWPGRPGRSCPPGQNARKQAQTARQGREAALLRRRIFLQTCLHVLLNI